MPSKHRTLLVDACAVGCPLILVMAVRTFFTPAPSDASPAGAAPTPPAAPAAAPAPVKLDPQQQKAAEWVASLASVKGLTSPLDHPTAAPPPRPEPKIDNEPTPEPAPAVDPLAGLKLSGILGNDDGGLAAISGKIYRVGDQVRPGLKLKGIDAKTNTVIFTLDNGSEIKLHRKPQ